MATKRIVPKRLYKFRVFSDRTLEALIADELYFSDPSKFYDPLDCRPCLETDVNADALASILWQLVQQRVNSEMSAAADALKARGPKSRDHIAAHSSRRADQVIAEIRQSATDPAYEFEDPELHLFGLYIQGELLRRYDKGIVALAEHYNCPLMWSHYGDQHRGVCMGYSVPEHAAANIFRVRYGGSRLIRASSVLAMLNGNESAKEEVDRGVLTLKAKSWEYEKEWRLLGPRGSQASPLELEEIIFGMRSSHAVQFTIVKALSDRGRPVKFYEMRERHGRFQIDRRALETDEMLAVLPQRALDMCEAFEPFSD